MFWIGINFVITKCVDNANGFVVLLMASLIKEIFRVNFSNILAQVASLQLVTRRHLATTRWPLKVGVWILSMFWIMATTSIIIFFLDAKQSKQPIKWLTDLLTDWPNAWRAFMFSYLFWPNLTYFNLYGLIWTLWDLFGAIFQNRK